MEIKKKPSSYVPKGHPLKCKECNSWTKKQIDGPRICVNCYYRNKAKEEAARAAENIEQPVKPNIKIGKI